MKSNTTNNVKLGLFVLASLFFLILLLYLIGKNSNMFGSNYILKARFENVQGLKAGNNIRYAGIDIGTVKSVYIINDTTMEVKMIIDNKAKNIIKKNSLVYIGTDGLVGNKVVNIFSVKEDAPFAVENDILPSKKAIDTDDMMRTLSKTNIQISKIAEDFSLTINKLNNSQGLWKLLNDPTIADNISNASFQVKKSSYKINEIANQINDISNEIKNGNGTLSKLINDKNLADSLTVAVNNFKNAAHEITEAGKEINNSVALISKEVNEGKGSIHSILKDTSMSILLEQSMKNIEMGTKGFSDNMEALKHNFLFRGYFRKLEKRNNQ
jgi:phospholipid/cholesterol/gamma-HCH transport system substrate-binding protein